MDILFSSDFEEAPEVGALIDKPITTGWAASGTHSLHYFGGSLDSYGFVQFEDIVKDNLKVSFKLFVPADSDDFNGFRIIGSTLTSLSLDIRLTVTGTDVFISSSDQSNVLIGEKDEEIAIVIYATNSKTSIYINNSLTPIEGIGNYNFDYGFGWNQNGGVELFLQNNDDFYPLESHFYLDDLLIETESLEAVVDDPSKSGIVFPPELPRPLRTQYDIGFEETRLRQERELGAFRQRRIVRTEPRLEKIAFVFTQEQYKIFDYWWHTTIKAGSLLFDIQLSDDQIGVIWYSARWMGEYQAEITSEKYEWKVTGTLRLTETPFLNRVPGTDDLHGKVAFQLSAKGKLEVLKPLYGSVSFKMSNKLKLLTTKMAGKCDLSINAKAIGIFGSIPLYGSANLQLIGGAKDQGLSNAISRIAIGVDSIRNSRSSDKVYDESVRYSNMRF